MHVTIQNIVGKAIHTYENVFAKVPAVIEFAYLTRSLKRKMTQTAETITCEYRMARVFPIVTSKPLTDLVKKEYIATLCSGAPQMEMPYYMFISAEDNVRPSVIHLGMLEGVEKIFASKYSHYYDVHNGLVKEYAQRMVNTFILLVFNKIAPCDVEFVLGLESIRSEKPVLYMIDFNQTRNIDPYNPIKDAVVQYANLAGVAREHYNVQYQNEEAHGQWRFLPWPTLTPRLFFECMLEQPVDATIAVDMVKYIEDILNEQLYQYELRVYPHKLEIFKWRPALSSVVATPAPIVEDEILHLIGEYTMDGFMEYIHSSCAFHTPNLYVPRGGSPDKLYFYSAPFAKTGSNYAFVEVNAYISLDFAVQRILVNKAAADPNSKVRDAKYLWYNGKTFKDLQDKLNEDDRLDASVPTTPNDNFLDYI